MPDEFTSEEEKSFDYALSVTKQVITLSTAVLTATVTLAKFVAQDKVDPTFLFLAWLILIFSIVAGLWTQYQLTTQLIKEARDGVPSIKERSVWGPALAQLLLFIFGLGFLVGYTMLSICTL
uniref:Uncharacterized protein n=1 Tax=Candidatus Kentrum sp. MB TaxID=2138164 RepID=A0A451BB70_9GAMM|nr:MAG: hypothetical protein BECKMB1821G_GA0114241_101228 [Candidatus Kentron sp. MB]VFK31485.1 MAG: hypothetical protein BECKMB1821I_GA0114274_10246 [Candidatus Kentron sp. MB]VFK75530.1 MAG: hypothetical protein BECKMB1821H_GA0114242_10255 [Candidatus Kentron sp. MB]